MEKNRTRATCAFSGCGIVLSIFFLLSFTSVYLCIFVIFSKISIPLYTFHVTLPTFFFIVTLLLFLFKVLTIDFK